MYRIIAVALALAAIAPRGLSGQFDWPQWQGPDRTAHSKETGLLKEWPKDGPPLAWKVKGLGGGDSNPSIAAGRIYGMSHRGSDEFVWALSEKDGKEIWAVRIAPAFTTSWPQSKEGPIVLIEPSRKEYLERGRFNQPERTDKPAWAHPVIANGKLYIRDQDTLFCYDVKAK